MWNWRHQKLWGPWLKEACLDPPTAWAAKQLHISRASRLLLLFFLPGGLTESWQLWSLWAGLLCSEFLGILPNEICRGASSLGALQSLRQSWSNNFFQTPTLCQPARSTVEERGRGLAENQTWFLQSHQNQVFHLKWFLTHLVILCRNPNMSAHGSGGPASPCFRYDGWKAWGRRENEETFTLSWYLCSSVVCQLQLFTQH